MISILYASQQEQLAHELGLWLEEGRYGAGGLSFGDPERSFDLGTLAISQAVVVIISPELIADAGSFTSHIETIKRLHLPVIPVLYKLSNADFRTHDTVWSSLVGHGVTVEIPKEGLVPILSRVLAALKALNVEENEKRNRGRIGALREFTGRDLSGGTGIIAKRKRLRRRILLGALAGMILLAGLVEGIQYYRIKKQQAEPPRMVLRLHGSNTIGASLAPALIDRFAIKNGSISSCWFPGTHSQEKKLVYRMPHDSTKYAIELFTHGSAFAFSDLADSTADIGMASRSVKPEENEFLKKMKVGDVTSPAGEHIIGLDGIAIIVHPSNSVNSLTIEQVAGIFSGKIKQWSQVGGDAKPIVVFSREKTSGTFDTFENLVLKRYGYKDVDTSAKRFEDSKELSSQVAKTENGIGFIGLPYVNESKAIAIADGEAPAVYPNMLTIAREDYPLARRLYLYSPTNPANALTREFIRFTVSDEGQEMVNQIGFIDLRVYAESNVVPPSTAPAEYIHLAQSAKRLSAVLRFKKGSDSFDNKAIQDIDRIVNYVRRNGTPQILLAGFTDSDGEKKRLNEISRGRAQIVAEEFHSRGLLVEDEHVYGFGASLPLTTSTTPEGKQKNRRVEVWIQ
jgi:phosphate transport system substrate-binding protein